MRYDDTKLRAAVREATLWEAAVWCAERMDEAFGKGQRAKEAAFLAALEHFSGLADECKQKPNPAWVGIIAAPEWDGIDGGLDG